MTNSYPLLEAVAEHHKKILGIYDEYLGNEGDSDAQTRLTEQLSWELERHAFAEIHVVHPLLTKYLGGEGVEEDLAEHNAIRIALILLRKIQPDSPEHDAALKAIVERFKPHAQSEEEEELLGLEKVIDHQVSQNAAITFRKIVRAKLPIDSLPDFLASPIDKLKDVFSNALLEEERGVAVGRN